MSKWGTHHKPGEPIPTNDNQDWFPHLKAVQTLGREIKANPRAWTKNHVRLFEAMMHLSHVEQWIQGCSDRQEQERVGEGFVLGVKSLMFLARAQWDERQKRLNPKTKENQS